MVLDQGLGSCGKDHANPSLSTDASSFREVAGVRNSQSLPLRFRPLWLGSSAHDIAPWTRAMCCRHTSRWPQTRRLPESAAHDKGQSTHRKCLLPQSTSHATICSSLSSEAGDFSQTSLHTGGSTCLAQFLSMTRRST